MAAFRGAEQLLQRVPPHSEDGERLVLGAIFNDPNCFYTVSALVQEDTFFFQAHRHIFRAMSELMAASGKIDTLLVADSLRRAGVLDEVGGFTYLEKLADSYVPSAHVEGHARLVAEESTKRHLIELAHQLVNDGFDPSRRAGEIMEEAEARLIVLSRAAQGTEVAAIGDIVSSTLDQIEARARDPSAVPGTGTGLVELDAHTGGFHPGQLIILAGRTSHGKTVLALNFAHHVGVKLHKPVLVFSLEMTREELVMRLLCADAMVDAKKVQHGFVHPADWEKLMLAADALADAPIYIDDNASLGLMELRAKARRLKSERPDLGLIVVDYLQLMSLNQRIESRQQEIAMISRGLKILAKDLEVPVLALSQLSRKVEDRPGKRPQLSDLRESGAIEQDADVVIFIFRPERATGTKPEDGGGEGRAEVIIGKQRNGPLGIIPVAFLGPCMRFVNLARDRDLAGGGGAVHK
ncbi:MAG: replicative DNA helicase [Candidatus Schekmanbacteria bacterium]|nr:replicative DNA helicase [Candidatus Schekmanbacteria bacterium]